MGERVGRELLAPLWARGVPQPRVHLIGRYFGAPFLTAAVLGGAPAQSLTLLQPALSAFAFADAVPGFDRPGFYHRIIDEQRVRGPVVVVSTRDDRRLTAFYDQRFAAPRDDSSSSVTRTRTAVAGAAMGLAGARGSGATDLDLRELFRIGLPAAAVANIDAGDLTFDIEQRGGADGAHVPPELVKIALMAAGFGLRGAA